MLLKSKSRPIRCFTTCSKQAGWQTPGTGNVSLRTALLWHSWVCIFQSKNQLVASFAISNFAAAFYKFQTCKQVSSCKPPLFPHELSPITLISRRQIADSGFGFPTPSWNSPFISLFPFFIYFWGLNDIERQCSSPLFDQDKIIDVGTSSWANPTNPKKTHRGIETHRERTCSDYLNV